MKKYIILTGILLSMLCGTSLRAQIAIKIPTLPNQMYFYLPLVNDINIPNCRLPISGTTYDYTSITFPFRPGEMLKVELTGGKLAEYQWYVDYHMSGIDPIAISGQTGSTLNLRLNSDAQNYTATYKCVATIYPYIVGGGIETKTFTVNVRIGAAPRIAKIYPNPARDIVHVELEGSDESARNTKISVMDASGNLVKPVQNTSGKNIEVDISILPKGRYFIHSEKEGNRSSKQLYINR
ncbi:MAG: T9SS type A sorting domain-containing protein [Bacteroidales bacterium]